MKKRLVDLRGEKPLLDIVSYGRGGPGSLSRSQREYVERTTRRVPEVVVKVSGGARTLAGVERNMRYVVRSGKLGVEADTGERLGVRGFESDLIYDWDLDLEARARYTQRSIRSPRKPPKLVHNLIFSMVPGTPPDKVLKAVRKLARNQFGSRHRHVMVLHTDEPHPHVHVIVKAMGEDGKRLNIRKETLREWRGEFAANLRELGVAANATERAVRGKSEAWKRDGIYRAAQRGESTYLQKIVRQSAAGAPGEHPRNDTGLDVLLRTRESVIKGYREVSENLRADGYAGLASDVDAFIASMPPARADIGATMSGSDWARHEASTRPPRTR